MTLGGPGKIADEGCMQIDESHSLTCIEDVLWVVGSSIGMARYDFAFEEHFRCRHPVRLERPVRAVARLGACEDYAARFEAFSRQGITLVHTPAEYQLTSSLPDWYPRLADLTARSEWFDAPPPASMVSERFGWPVFVKGERQTSRHQRKLSILNGPAEYEAAVETWRRDPILSWQRMVCREFLPLRLVGEQAPHAMPRAFEFRSFWWKGECVGIGPYWQDAPYEMSVREREAALALGADAARRIGVTFLVVDLAQTRDGRWVVIEINDGQDAGYAGVKPYFLWRRVIELESRSA